MHDDDVGVQAVDPRRQHEIKRRATGKIVSPTEQTICDYPSEEFHEMRTAHRRDFAPKDSPHVARARRVGIVKNKIFDAPRVEMDFAAEISCQALEQFGKGALGAVAPINEGRYHCDTQFSEPSDVGASWPPRRLYSARKTPGLGGEIEFR